uniref:Ig-like domain-containing protein n=1 Tax=Neogobius melanostomus TaxID=47308 RepID=A0A8C6V276_9GOBI
MQIFTFLTIFSLEDYCKPVPVLSVSLLWLSPGSSVSLKCNVTAPSAGWRFYWYRAVPLPSGSYSYELLPGLTSGTAHGSFTVHSLSSTAGFVCRASRGSPEVYTEYSPPQFVWSADAGSRVSPIVSPNSSQHLTYDTVSVSCGSSDEDWRVQMFSLTNLSLHRCPSQTGDKHECKLSTDEEIRAVFWCESGRGEMTDAVNITIHSIFCDLVDPAQPVPEGCSVSLTCKLGQSAEFSSVRFYKDGQLIQEGSLRTYSFSALSKSDEGLYKCGIHLTSNKVLTSPESWLSVRGESSSVLVLVLVGAVFLIVLLILLLVLWRYRNNKGTAKIQITLKCIDFI